MNSFNAKASSFKVDFNVGLTMYRVMRIRMKIGYSAWRKQMTVSQLLFQTIHNSYIQLSKRANVIRLDMDKILFEVPLIVALKQLYFPTLLVTTEEQENTTAAPTQL